MKDIEPKIWGPLYWTFLHFVAKTYSDKPTSLEKKNFYDVFYGIFKILPCKLCRNNIKIKLKKIPLDDEVLKNNVNLNKWLNMLHNEVTKSIIHDNKNNKNENEPMCKKCNAS
jgi:hypothetical protein